MAVPFPSLHIVGSLASKLPSNSLVNLSDVERWRQERMNLMYFPDFGGVMDTRCSALGVEGWQHLIIPHHTYLVARLPDCSCLLPLKGTSDSFGPECNFA